MATVILKKGEGRTIKAGGAWIFDNEIDKIDGYFENGDIIRVEDFDGFKMGVGFINTNSKITVRMLARWRDEIDDDFLYERVRNAWEYRKKTVDINACRVIFGEADFLPGLVVDKFNDVLVVESLALGIDKLKNKLIGFLVEILEKDGIKIRGVYERSDAAVRKKEGMEPFKGFIGEPFDTEVEIVENGVKYIVDVEDGQKTGFFLDQKYNRKAIQGICRDSEVLDCFTHTGSFALNAAYGGARHVTAVDISETAIAQAKKNAEINGFTDRVEFITENVLDLLPKLAAEEKKYDVVILDPPAFTKSREATKKAVKGYREINMKGMKLVKNGGFLATCSCSHFMTEELFKKTIKEAAHAVHKRLRQVEFRTQSPDHPILWAADESYYLKFIIFQVVDEK